MNKKVSKEPVSYQGQNCQVTVVNQLVESMLMEPKSKHRGLYYQIIEQLKSGFEIIPIRISYFKHNDQIHQWIIETCKKEVERYLKLAIIQFAKSLNISIIQSNFKVRLIK
ncbi:MAG: hypothetical protein L0H53_11690 [Candidatus Nitrosocosmicus sp.]|nr:hypothetical protein [Candidatus Nitrosocosmicus sp.]MDN5868384.1 hypothetical protein [Candidatus Nitrosocosmicus sp.]